MAERYSKLTFDMAVEISTRLIHGTRGTARRLAEEFGCSESLIYEIKRGATWKKAYRKALEQWAMQSALDKMRKKK